MMEPVSIEKVSETTGKLIEMPLVQMLRQKGQNHLRAGMRWFAQHLRAHTEGKGQKLLTNYRRAAFYLSKHDEGIQLTHAHGMLRLLALGHLANLILLVNSHKRESPDPRYWQQVEWSCPLRGPIRPNRACW
jgi:hypothetical protein